MGRHLSDLVDGCRRGTRACRGGSLVHGLSLFFDLKDLLHTTKRQDVLLGEQARLQEDLEERVKKLEVCQKEEERKQQHLQALQSEVEEKESELARQETVSCPMGGPGSGTLPRQASPRLLLPLPALCDLRGILHQLFDSLGINVMDH